MAAVSQEKGRGWGLYKSEKGVIIKKKGVEPC